MARLLGTAEQVNEDGGTFTPVAWPADGLTINNKSYDQLLEIINASGASRQPSILTNTVEAGIKLDPKDNNSQVPLPAIPDGESTFLMIHRRVGKTFHQSDGDNPSVASNGVLVDMDSETGVTFRLLKISQP